MKRLTGDSRTDAAIILLAAVAENGRSTDLTNSAARLYRDPRDFGLLRELVGGVLRRRMALEKIVEPCVSRGLDGTRPLLRETLLCHAYQAVFLDRIPPHARVSGAVNTARRLDGERGAKFVNAVTHAVERLVSDGIAPVLAAMSPWEKFSIPGPFARRIEQISGKPPETELETLSVAPPLAVRIRRSPELRERLLAELQKAETTFKTGTFAPDCLLLDSGRILSTSAVPELLVPQDQASQLVVTSLNPKNGEKILDMCCGTGIKTSQILDIAPECELYAVDNDTVKLDRNKELCRAMNLPKPNVRGFDATALPEEMDGTFDAVLLDAPCTGAGTVRRRPEVRYVRTEKDFDRAAILQRALLGRALRLVRPGGRIVFATCSFVRQEGIDVARSVLKTKPDFKLVPTGLDSSLESDDHTVTTLPWVHDMDGFFIAKIMRDNG